MGRFATLHADTQDVVNALLPAIARNFKVDDVKETIPEDIRMRAWDCDRRDHIKDKTEDDPRNWGVQFLKELMAISRIKDGNLAEFQADLRAKVAKHEPKHPWARLADIKELKVKYEHPDIPSEDEKSQEEYEQSSSTDTYLEELVEPEVPKGMKRGRKPRNQEIYEARLQDQKKRRKYGSSSSRLRRDSEGWERRDKSARYSMERFSAERHTPASGRLPVRRPIVHSDRDGSYDSMNGMSVPASLTPSFSASPRPTLAHSYPTYSIINSNEPLEVQKLQAELEVAEAELKSARLRMAYIEAKEKAEANRNATGTRNEPHEVE